MLAVIDFPIQIYLGFKAAHWSLGDYPLRFELALGIRNGALTPPLCPQSVSASSRSALDIGLCCHVGRLLLPGTPLSPSLVRFTILGPPCSPSLVLRALLGRRTIWAAAGTSGSLLLSLALLASPGLSPVTH